VWSRSRYTRRPGSLRERTGIVLRWPIGLLLVSWRYMWRVTPVYRRDEQGGPDDLPPPLPEGVGRDGVQGLADGVGPLLHRRYAVRTTEPREGPEQLVAQLATNPNAAAPEDAAVFVKSRGDSDRMEVGDEYVVRMPGPWDGPVRVVERTPTSFRFVTLDGHLEAGQIRFTASPGEFRIESWARAGDRLSNLLYDHLRMSKEIQLHMWTSVIERVAELAGGRLTGGIEIRTRRVD